MNYQEEEYTEKIQRFLSGDMTGEEKTEFEALMKNDEALRDEVEFQRGLTAFMKDEGALKIQNKVQELRNQQGNESSFPWRKAIAAVLIIAALAVPAYFFFANRTIEPTVLADNYFEPYPDMITQMGSDKDSLELALEYYNERKYGTAANVFKALGNDSLGYVSLYLSISQFQSNQHTEAVNTLRDRISQLDEESKLKPVYQWYLIIALLKDEKLDQAKTELKRYFEKGYRHNLDKAEKLAEDLGVKY